jgi:hypothetical protein
MKNPKLGETPLEIAESVLLDAGDAIRKRLDEHGHTERSFRMIGELWSVYMTHAYTARDELKLQPHDVAFMMDLMKTARAVYGYSRDNFVDKAGFTSLAAMLAPKPAKEPKRPTVIAMSGPVQQPQQQEEQ